MTDGVYSEALPLGDLLVRAEAAHPDRAALVFPDRSHSYRDLLAAAEQVARALFALGVRPGQHVGLLMPNSPELIEGMFGASLLGCVVVPLNARFRSSELSYVIDHADLVAVLTTNSAEDHVDFSGVLRDSLPTLREAPDPTELSLPEAPRLRTVALLRGGATPGMIGQQEFYALADATVDGELERIRQAVRVRDTAMILYTSGTTARPKGCLLSHESVTRGCVGRLRENTPLQGHDVFWAAGPLFHISSLQVLLGSIGIAGTYATDVYFQADRAARMIRDLNVTSAWPWFPAVMQDLLLSDEFDPAELTSLRSIMCIGPESLLRRVQSLFPGALHMNSSGMTEAGGIYAWSKLTDDADERATAGGKPVAGFDIRILHPDTGEEAGDDVVGEILVRGYSLMDGYYKDPAKTAEAIDDDRWLHTGDLYSRSAKGGLTFHGRLKDMLKVGGENVPAIEVEAFLVTHPAIKIAEVVGRPDPRLDEVPVVFVELKPGMEVGGDEIIAFCRGRIASYKVPRAVYFKTQPEWPMALQKVNKGILRQEALALQSKENL